MLNMMIDIKETFEERRKNEICNWFEVTNEGYVIGTVCVETYDSFDSPCSYISTLEIMYEYDTLDVQRYVIYLLSQYFDDLILNGGEEIISNEEYPSWNSLSEIDFINLDAFTYRYE